jgi:hypothetical protein
MAEVKIPVGNVKPVADDNTPKETPEQIAAREAAEAEATRLAEEEAAKKAKEEADKNNTPPADDKPKTILFEVDGKDVEYNLDDKGNAIDEVGSIVYTAEQIAEMSASSEGDDKDKPTTQIATIASISGIKILDDKGKEKTYDDTVDGFAQREKDIHILGQQVGYTKAQQDFFAQNPEFESMYKYKQTYGSLDNYSAFVDYSKVAIDPTNEALMKDLVVKAEISRGNSNDKAQRFLKISVADGTLAKDAEEALSYLKTKQEAETTAAASARKAELDAQQAKEDAYFGVTYDEKGNEKVLNIKGSVYDLVVNKGQIGAITIPKDGLTVKGPDGNPTHYTRKQIFDYIEKPVYEYNGAYYTQAQVDDMNARANIDNLLGGYIKNLLGGDMSQVVEAAKRKDTVNTIKKIVVKSSSTKTPTQGANGNKEVIIPVKR